MKSNHLLEASYFGSTVALQTGKRCVLRLFRKSVGGTMEENLRWGGNSDRRSACRIGVAIVTIEKDEKIQSGHRHIRFSLRIDSSPSGIGPNSFRANYFLKSFETESSRDFDSKYAITSRPSQKSESIDRVVWLFKGIYYAEKVSSPFKKRASVDAFKNNLFSNSDFVSRESRSIKKNEASYYICIGKISNSHMGIASMPGRRLCPSIISRLPLKSNTSKLFCNNVIPNLAIHFKSSLFLKVRSNFDRNQNFKK